MKRCNCNQIIENLDKSIHAENNLCILFRLPGLPPTF